MNWNQLLNGERRRSSKSSGAGTRSEFQKDYHRIIVSSAFRRLQDKTQVFPLEKSDFIRTRLTHSLEVSSIAKSLGQAVCKRLNNLGINDLSSSQETDISDILLSAGLLHDIGNPPFGHFGELVIQEWFKKNLNKLEYNNLTIDSYLDKQMLNDLKNFEGNAQSLRIVTKLHSLIDLNGMNLTKGLLCTIVKYPCSSTEKKTTDSIIHKKMGYYYSEKDVFTDIVNSTGLNNSRHPLTFLLEAADDISYLTADVEDASKKRLINVYKIFETTKEIKIKYEGDEVKYLDQAIDQLKYFLEINSDKSAQELIAIQNWIIYIQGLLINCVVFSFTKNYSDIMHGNYNEDLFEGTYGKGLVELLKKLAIKYIFNDVEIQKLEIAAEKIIGNLLSIFIPSIIKYDTETEMTGFDKRVLNLISKSYLSVYNEVSANVSEMEKLYLRLLLVTDFISGMTDSYAKNLYKELNGLDL